MNIDLSSSENTGYLLNKNSTTIRENNKAINLSFNKASNLSLQSEQKHKPKIGNPEKPELISNYREYKKDSEKFANIIHNYDWSNKRRQVHKKIFEMEYPNKVYVLDRNEKEDPIEMVNKHQSLDVTHMEQLGKIKPSVLAKINYEKGLERMTRQNEEKSNSDNSLLEGSYDELVDHRELEKFKEYNQCDIHDEDQMYKNFVPAQERIGFFKKGNELEFLKVLYGEIPIENMVTLVRTKLFDICSNLSLSEKNLQYDNLLKITAIDLKSPWLQDKTKQFKQELMLIDQLSTEQNFDKFSCLKVDKKFKNDNNEMLEIFAKSNEDYEHLLTALQNNEEIQSKSSDIIMPDSESNSSKSINGNFNKLIIPIQSPKINKKTPKINRNIASKATFEPKNVSQSNNMMVNLFNKKPILEDTKTIQTEEQSGHQLNHKRIGSEDTQMTLIKDNNNIFIKNSQQLESKIKDPSHKEEKHKRDTSDLFKISNAGLSSVFAQTDTKKNEIKGSFGEILGNKFATDTKKKEIKGAFSEILGNKFGDNTLSFSFLDVFKNAIGVEVKDSLDYPTSDKGDIFNQILRSTFGVFDKSLIRQNFDEFSKRLERCCNSKLPALSNVYVKVFNDIYTYLSKQRNTFLNINSIDLAKTSKEKPNIIESSMTNQKLIVSDAQFNSDRDNYTRLTVDIMESKTSYMSVINHKQGHHLGNDDLSESQRQIIKENINKKCQGTLEKFKKKTVPDKIKSPKFSGMNQTKKITGDNFTMRSDKMNIFRRSSGNFQNKLKTSTGSFKMKSKDQFPDNETNFNKKILPTVEQNKLQTAKSNTNFSSFLQPELQASSKGICNTERIITGQSTDKKKVKVEFLFDKKKQSLPINVHNYDKKRNSNLKNNNLTHINKNQVRHHLDNPNTKVQALLQPKKKSFYDFEKNSEEKDNKYYLSYNPSEIKNNTEKFLKKNLLDSPNPEFPTSHRSIRNSYLSIKDPYRAIKGSQISDFNSQECIQKENMTNKQHIPQSKTYKPPAKIKQEAMEFEEKMNTYQDKIKKKSSNTLKNKFKLLRRIDRGIKRSNRDYNRLDKVFTTEKLGFVKFKKTNLQKLRAEQIFIYYIFFNQIHSEMFEFMSFAIKVKIRSFIHLFKYKQRDYEEYKTKI